MKKIGLLLLSAIIMLTASCADKNAFTLTGKVVDTNQEGEKVYLQELKEDGTALNALDTAVIKNGQFIFKGIAAETPAVRFITMAAPSTPRPYLFILEPGKIEMVIDSIPSVKGTPLNDDYQQFESKTNEMSLKMKTLGDEYRNLSISGSLTQEEEKRISGLFDKNMEEMSGIVFEYIKSNISNPIGEFFFLNATNNMEDAQIKELIALARPEFKANERVDRLAKYLDILENSGTGKQFIDVNGKTPEGNDIALSDYAGKGQIILIDFWASWCPPCRRDMPLVVEAYKKYKNKGLEIVGISLDEDVEAWKKTIKDLNVSWPQMSDLKGWDSELSKVYGVNEIPHTILIDKDGKIIARGIKAEDIESTLDELFK